MFWYKKRNFAFLKYKKNISETRSVYNEQRKHVLIEIKMIAIHPLVDLGMPIFSTIFLSEFILRWS